LRGSKEEMQRFTFAAAAIEGLLPGAADTRVELPVGVGDVNPS